MRADLADITSYLEEFSQGDQAALNELMPLIYERLYGIAKREMRKENAAITLSATALVNEAYLDLSRQNDSQWRDRNHFLAVASIVMRRILVDHARHKLRQKRGAGAVHVSLDEVVALGDAKSAYDLLEIDQLLNQLAEINERAARVVECRFFAGLSNAETAQVLKASPATIKRDWQMARAWLKREMSGQGEV